MSCLIGHTYGRILKGRFAPKYSIWSVYIHATEHHNLVRCARFHLVCIKSMEDQGPWHPSIIDEYLGLGSCSQQWYLISRLHFYMRSLSTFNLFSVNGHWVLPTHTRIVENINCSKKRNTFATKRNMQNLPFYSFWNNHLFSLLEQ